MNSKKFVPSCGIPATPHFLAHFPIAFQTTGNVFHHIVSHAEIEIVQCLHQYSLVVGSVSFKNISLAGLLGN